MSHYTNSIIKSYTKHIHRRGNTLNAEECVGEKHVIHSTRTALHGCVITCTIIGLFRCVVLHLHDRYSFSVRLRVDVDAR